MTIERRPPGRLVFGENERVSEWCRAQIVNFSGWGSDPQSIGYEIGGQLVGAVIYTNYSGKNVFATIACTAPISKRFLYSMFWCPFAQFGVNHISCVIEASNKRSRALCSHMGFKQEGTIREAAQDGGDIILMGMLRSECRFLKIGRPRHENYH